MILAATSLDSFVQLITVLIIFVFVLILTYFTTRWMAGIQNYLTELKEEELKDLSFKDPQSMTQNTESFSAIMDKLKEKYGNRSRHE